MIHDLLAFDRKESFEHALSILVISAIAVPPSIILSPVDSNPVSPEPAMFSCTAEGVPRPNISWWRMDNETEVTVSENSFTRISTTTLDDCHISSILTFTETQPFMSGVYVCSATNEVASARKCATLSVGGKFK